MGNIFLQILSAFIRIFGSVKSHKHSKNKEHYTETITVSYKCLKKYTMASQSIEKTHYMFLMSRQ